MIELTGKEKRQLRSEGKTLDPAITIGKAGLTPELIHQVRQVMLTHPLIKVRLPQGPAAMRTKLAEDLSAGADAALAGTVGRTILLYRPEDDSAE